MKQNKRYLIFSLLAIGHVLSQSVNTEVLPSLDSFSGLQLWVQNPSAENKSDGMQKSILEDEVNNLETEKQVVEAVQEKEQNSLRHQQHKVTDMDKVDNAESQVEIESRKQKRLRDPNKIDLKNETVTLGERQGTSETELKNTTIQPNELGLPEETEVTGSLETSKPSKGETTARESTKAVAAELKKKLKRCRWIADLLGVANIAKYHIPEVDRGEHNSMWKTPILHTTDPVSGVELMILGYKGKEKKQEQKQSKGNFRNTIDILTRFYKNPLFPELFGYCPDFNGVAMVAVEYISIDSFAQEKPKSLEACVNKAEKVFDAFDQLDELKLVHMDLKANQWMHRENGVVVFQDIDDIVPAPSPPRYQPHIIKTKKITAEYNSEKMNPDEFRLAWSQMFPEEKYDIRYNILQIVEEVMKSGLSFEWNKRDCPGYTPEFGSCMTKLYMWAYSLTDDWPDFSQMKGALRVCFTDLEFVKPTTPHRSWSDV